MEQMSVEQWQQAVRTLATEMCVVMAPQTALKNNLQVTFYSEEAFQEGCLRIRADFFQEDCCVHKLHAYFLCTLLQEREQSAADIFLFEDDQVAPVSRYRCLKFENAQHNQQWIEHIHTRQSDASWGYQIATPIEPGLYQVAAETGSISYFVKKGCHWFFAKHISGSASQPPLPDVSVQHAQRGQTDCFLFDAVFQVDRRPISFAKHVLLPVSLADGLYTFDFDHKTCTLLDSHLKPRTTTAFFVTDDSEIPLIISMELDLNADEKQSYFEALSACPIPFIIHLSLEAETDEIYWQQCVAFMQDVPALQQSTVVFDRSLILSVLKPKEIQVLTQTSMSTSVLVVDNVSLLEAIDCPMTVKTLRAAPHVYQHVQRHPKVIYQTYQQL